MIGTIKEALRTHEKERKPMKTKIFCLLLMLALLCAASALAETDLIETVLRQAGLSQPIQLQQSGNTAACFAEAAGVKRLILLEQRDGEWQIVINNPTALIQDNDYPRLWLDNDDAVFWTYTLNDASLHFHSVRSADGAWGPVDERLLLSGSGDYTREYATLWDDARGGEIIRSYAESDENDNLLPYGSTLEYYPATWLGDCIRLADFDLTRFPCFDFDGGEWWFATNTYLREAAAALMPDCAYLDGLAKNGALHFLVRKPDGTKRYVICEYASHRAARLIESTPLPEDTYLGVENFTDSLWIHGRCVTVQLMNNGTAGLEYIYDDAPASDNFLFFGYRTVWNDSRTQTVLYGDHPWDDITEIDWETLPRTLPEAAARMDSSRFAVVTNPDPKDRLHLRERADKGSLSQGKYYSGTPVLNLNDTESRNWNQVMVGLITEGGQRGWMMKKYLTYGRPGDALWLDTRPMPNLFSKGEALKVYTEPQIGAYTLHWNATGYTMKVIGVIGDEWYHVWFPATGEYGFVLQSDLWEGNG